MKFEEHRADIQQHVKALCLEFGVDYKRVTEIKITPVSIHFKVFLEDDEGKLRIDKRYGRAAMIEIDHKVRT